MKPLFSVLVIGAMCSGSVFAEAYKIDPSHAEILFKINHLGFSNTFGKFSVEGGEVVFDPAQVEKASVQVEIDPASIDFGHKDKEDHLKSDDFFHVEQFPQASFTSTEVRPTGENTFALVGDLSFLGQTQSITLDVVLNKVGEHPFNKKQGVGFSATTKLDRTDWGMDYMVPLVGEEVELWIEIEAYK